MKVAVAPAQSSLTDCMISLISNGLYVSTHMPPLISSLASTEVLG